MEKFRSPGSSSLPSDFVAEEISRLRAISLSSPIQSLLRILGENSALHIVGGTVRDVFEGLEQCDIDLATILPPDQVVSSLQASGIHVVETGILHGTVTALPESMPVEITTFRTPGARASFEPSRSIAEDLAGRDFTINAMAYCIQDGTLHDPFGGCADLEKGILRAVGDAKTRFAEDPLRVLRMVRFGPAAGRAIEASTLSAARGVASSLTGVSVERVRVELEKILLLPFPRKAFALMNDCGLLEIILPEIVPSIGFEQNEFHTEDVFSHTLSVVENTAPERILRLAALFHDLGKPASLTIEENGRRHFYNHELISVTLAERAMRRLRFSNDDIDAVKCLVGLHMRPLECGPAGVRRLIRELGPQFDTWRALKMADRTPVMPADEFTRKLDEFDRMLEEEKNRKVGSPYDHLAVDGNDLIALGMSEGPQIGNVLKALHELVIEDPEQNRRDLLLAQAKKMVEAA